MKKRIAGCVLFFCSVCFSLPVAAQNNNPQSLLWRISGNGLSAPSYLFGTMHVKNKKAFLFKDSLYYFIEHTDGFAMEIHPDSISRILKAYTDGRLDLTNLEEYNDKSFDTKEMKNFFEKLKKDTSLSKKSPKEKISYLAGKMLDSKAEDENGMDTFMDGFLFGLARQNEKKIFGLEQVEDQVKALGYLSKGFRYKNVNDLLDKWDTRSSSPIYKYYYKEQIDSIYQFFTTYFSDSSLKGFLFDRNIVMASQMDSLMKRQTMFTAVGTGHLAGKEGVIMLLRNKGYLVEPVFSSQKIFAGDYKVKPMADNWINYKSENFGFAYQMPGNTEKQTIANGNEINYYYDLAGGILFMTIGGRLSAAEFKNGNDSLFNTQVRRMTQSVNGTLVSKKAIELQGLKGYEALTSSRANGYSKITEVFDGKKYYMLLVTAEKKENLNSEKAGHFINSFVTFHVKEPAWQKLEIKKEGFAIEFPGEVQTEATKTSKESKVSINGHIAFDGSSGIAYSVYFSKVNPGSSLLKGKSFFNTYIKSLKENYGEGEIIETDTVINGYPGLKFTTTAFEDKISEGLILKRNNISYFISVECDVAQKNNDGIKKFLHSFEFIAFPEANWKKAVSPSADFSSWVPGDIKMVEKDTASYYTSTAGSVSYYSFNANDAVEYTINVNECSPYYWAPNEDSVYNYWKKQTVSAWTDSVISYTTISNGGIAGRELISINKNNHTKTRNRLLLNGRKMYTLGLEVPETYSYKKDDNLFFEEFRITKEEKTSDIFTTSADKLFNDLQSKDSATFEMAYEALNEVQFLPQQFHLLLEKSLLEFPEYSNTYITVNEKLLTEATAMTAENAGNADSMARFIKDHYAADDKIIAKQRYQLLGILAGRHTTASYQLIKELLAAKLPGGPNQYRFFGSLYNDSFLLTSTLYPDLLRYVTDTSNGTAILALTKTLIDSSYLDTAILKPVQADILNIASRQLLKLLKLGADDNDYDYNLPEVIRLLGYLKQKTADDILAGYIKVKPVAIKYEAAVALIKNGRPVSAAEINKIAAEDEYRYEFYDGLKKVNKLNLFPAEFATQKNIGKSYIHKQMANMDDIDQNIQLIFIKMIEQEYKGVTKRFFLFRANIGDGDEYGGEDQPADKESYLAIAGPFNIDTKKITLTEEENISGVYYEKEFDGVMNDEYFKKYIDQFLKDHK